MSKKDKSDDKSDTEKKIWLAGLGAYGKSLGGSGTKSPKDMPKLFKDLVAKGTALEDEARNQLNERITEPLNKSKSNIEQRIEKVRQSLGLSNSIDTETVARLEDKIDNLTKVVETLTKAVKASNKKKT